MEENYLKGGIWHLYWAGGRKDSTLSDILHEKECYYKLHFPFLQPKQHAAKAYDELEIPHVCGVIDRARLHKMYLEMRKKEVPVKMMKSKSFSRIPKCFSVKKKSLPKSFELRPSKVTSINEKPSSKPSLHLVEKTNSLKLRKSVSFQDGVCVINISPNRNKKFYTTNEVSQRNLNNDLLSPDNSKLCEEALTNKSTESNKNTSDNMDKRNKRCQNTLVNINKSHIENVSSPEISTLPESMKKYLSCVLTKDSHSGLTNRVLEINQSKMSIPSMSSDSTDIKKLIPKPETHLIIPRVEEGLVNDNEQTLNKPNQSNQENCYKSDTEKVLFLQNLSLTENSLEEEKKLEENKDIHTTDLARYGNTNLPCHTAPKKNPKTEKKQGNKPRIKSKKRPKTKRPFKNSAESYPSIPHSIICEADDTKEKIKDSKTSNEKYIQSKRDISVKSKGCLFSLDIEKDSRHTDNEISSTFNDLNTASCEEESVPHKLKSNNNNDRNTGSQDPLEEHSLNSKQKEEEKTYKNIFERSVCKKNVKKDQLADSATNICLTQLSLSSSASNSNLRPKIESDVISSSSSKQIQSELVRKDEHLSLEVNTPSLLQKSCTNLIRDKINSKNESNYLELSNDSISSSNHTTSVLELERVPYQRVQLAEKTEEHDKLSPQVQCVQFCDSQVQLSPETINTSKTQRDKETTKLPSCFAYSNINNLHYLRESRIAHYRDTDDSSLESHDYSQESFQDTQMDVDSPANIDSENLSFLSKVTKHLNINDIDFSSSITDKCSEFSSEIINDVHCQDDNEEFKLCLKKYNSSVGNLVIPKSRSSIVSLNISLRNLTAKRKSLKFIDPSKNSEIKLLDDENMILKNITRVHTSEENSSSSESIILSPTDKELIFIDQESLEEVSTAYETEKETGKLKIGRYTQKIKKLFNKETKKNVTLGHIKNVHEILNNELNVSSEQNIKTEMEEGCSSLYSDRIKNSHERNVQGETVFFHEEIRKGEWSNECSCNSNVIEEDILERSSPDKHRDKNARVKHEFPLLNESQAQSESQNDKLALNEISNHGYNDDNSKSSFSEQINLEKFDNNSNSNNNLIKQAQSFEKILTLDKECISTKHFKFGSAERSEIKIKERRINNALEKHNILSKGTANLKHSLNNNSMIHSSTSAYHLNKSESILSASYSEEIKLPEDNKNFKLNWTFPCSSIASVNLVLEPKTLEKKVELSDRSNEQKSSVSIIDSSSPIANNKLEFALDKILVQKYLNRKETKFPNNQNEKYDNIKIVKYESKIQPNNILPTIVKSNILDHADNNKLPLPLESNRVGETTSLLNCTETEKNYLQEEKPKSSVFEKSIMQKEIRESNSDSQQSLPTVDNFKSSPSILPANVKSHKKRKNHLIRKKRAQLIKNQPLIKEILSSSEEEKKVNKKPYPKPWRRYRARNDPKPVYLECDIPKRRYHELPTARKSSQEDNITEIKKIDIKEFSSIKESMDMLKKTMVQKQEYSPEVITSSKNTDLDPVLVDQYKFKSIKSKSRILASDIFSSEENKSPQIIKASNECTNIVNKSNVEEEKEEVIDDNFKNHECENFQEKKSQNDHCSTSTSMREALKFEKWYRSRWVRDSLSTKSNLNVNLNNENELTLKLSADSIKSQELFKNKMSEVSFQSPVIQCLSDLQQSESYHSKYFEPCTVDMKYKDVECNIASENCQPLSEISNFQERFIVAEKNKEGMTPENINLDYVKEISGNKSSKTHIVSNIINPPSPNDITFNEKNKNLWGKRKSPINEYNMKQLKFLSPEKVVPSQNGKHSIQKRCSASTPNNKFKNEISGVSNDVRKENKLDMDETYQPETKKYIKSSVVRWMDLSTYDSTQGSNSPEKETLLRRTFFMGN